MLRSSDLARMGRGYLRHVPAHLPGGTWEGERLGRWGYHLVGCCGDPGETSRRTGVKAGLVLTAWGGVSTRESFVLDRMGTEGRG